MVQASVLKGRVRAVLAAVAALVVLVPATGCRPGRPAPLAGTPLSGLRDGNQFVPAWLPDGWIYFGFQPADVSQRVQIWRTRPGGSPERVALPDLAGCRLTDYRLPSRLPDGRLGLSRECLTDDPARDHIDLVAVDPVTKAVQILANLGLTNPSDAAWAPGLTTGFVAHADSSCASIAPLAHGAAGTFPGPVVIAGKARALDFAFRAPPSRTCAPDQIRADLVRLTPDGRTLVFLASLTSRSDSPWSLYRWRLDGGQPEEISAGFGDPLGIDLAPDGKSVVVGAPVDGADGLWRVDLATRARTRVAGGRLLEPAISPGGDRVVAVVQHGDGVNDTELRLFPFPRA